MLEKRLEIKRKDENNLKTKIVIKELEEKRLGKEKQTNKQRKNVEVKKIGRIGRVSRIANWRFSRNWKKFENWQLEGEEESESLQQKTILISMENNDCKKRIPDKLRLEEEKEDLYNLIVRLWKNIEWIRKTKKHERLRLEESKKLKKLLERYENDYKTNFNL